MKIPVGHKAGALDESVGERRLAVIDMGDDAEVAYSRCFQGSEVYREMAVRFNAAPQVHLMRHRRPWPALTGQGPLRSLRR
jgi:hypothetical protein